MTDEPHDDGLSWPDESPTEDAGGGTGGRGWLPPALLISVKAIIPVLVAGTFIALLIGEGSVVDNVDLQITVPSAQPPGHPIPVRAQVFAQTPDATMGVSFIETDVSVVVLDEERKALQEIVLKHKDMLGEEGQLNPLPVGTYIVRAEVSAPAPVAVEKQIVVRTDAPMLAERGYLSQPFQKFAVESTGADFRAEFLNVRVPRGVCSPEAKCALSIFVGTPSVPAPVQLVISENQNVTVEECVPFVSDNYVHPDNAKLCAIGEPTNGFLAPTIMISGSQATVTVLAFVEGKKVALRKIQLPISLGRPSLTIDRAMVDLEEPVQVNVEWVIDDHDKMFILDLFHEGHWNETRTHKSPATVKFSRPGLWRVQVRSDTYEGSETSRLIVVGQESPLEFIKTHPMQAKWKDPVVEGDLLKQVPPADQNAAAEFLLSRGEVGLPVMPRAMSSRAQNLVVSTKKIEGWRRQVALFMMACGLFVGLVIAFVGWRSNRQAEQVHLEAGTVPPKRWISLFFIVVAVILVFVLVAVMVMSRGAI